MATKSQPQVDKEIIDKAIKELTAALEAGMYGVPTPKSKLLNLLEKLGVKSARRQPLTVGGALQMESLSATLKEVTFDDTKLKLWKP